MAKIRTLLAVWIITCGLLLGSTTVSAAEVGQPGLSAGDTFVRKGQEDLKEKVDAYIDEKLAESEAPAAGAAKKKPVQA